jgi:hypothetical protein
MKFCIRKIGALLIGAVAIIAFDGPAALAQSGTHSGSTASPTIQQRKQNQQDRIANGVQTGALTAGETKNLERKQAGLNREERHMRSEDNGHLTNADRARLNSQQNRFSRQIYSDKNNAATAQYGKGVIGQRRENQQDRIAQGIRSGQLTPRETAHLENKEQGLNRELGGMRQANGGKLTKGDRALVNRQQNRLSGQIYAKKHNARRGY